jgi:hypothetical protein
MFEGVSLIIGLFTVALIVFGVLLSFFLILVLWLRLGTLKALSYVFGAVLAVMAILAALLLWETKPSAIPGVYHSDGVWGYSSLTLRPNHTFKQEVQFMEYDQPSVWPYKQHPTRHAVVEGHWLEHGRDLFDQKLVISSLMGLAPWDAGKVYEDFKCSYGPVQLSGWGIEVDAGADIVYRKCAWGGPCL